MADVVDLGAERNRREAPDVEHVRHDDFGRTLFCYLLSYDFADSQWSAQVWAYSMDDAEKRVEAMRESLRLDGQLYSMIPA